MQILIVDDEPAAIANLRSVLKHVVPDAEVMEAEDADSAVKICKKNKFDVAFVDIEMPGESGLELAKRLWGYQPYLNVIMATAYPQYALEAHRLYVSGYILKPAMEDEVRDALSHLRNPIKEMEEGLYVQCFGSFEVFYGGEIVRFKRKQSKELFAYLIDRRGAEATSGEIQAVLFEDQANAPDKQRDYFHKIWYDLRKTLEEIGCGDVLKHGRNSYCIVPDRIVCDYYQALAKYADCFGNFNGEYMSQYSWAETTLAGLINAGSPFRNAQH